jgi:hypothetical protein
VDFLDLEFFSDKLLDFETQQNQENWLLSTNKLSVASTQHWQIVFQYDCANRFADSHPPVPE